MASKMYELGVPTLQQISLVKATTTLMKCNSHFYKLILDLWIFRYNNYTIRKEIDEFWDEKINTLSIPESFKLLLLSFIEIEKLEIMNWLGYLNFIDVIHNFIHDNSYTSLLLNHTNYIQWSVHGQIDHAKTAQQLVTLDKDLSIHERFRLAACFCLENELKNIWKEHSNDLKTRYHHDYDFIECNDIYYFWILMLSSEIIGQNHRLFEMAIRSTNLSAMKYFWSRMTNEEKNSINFNIMEIVSVTNGHQVSILCFLLSQMSKQNVIDYLTSLHIEKSYSFLFELIRNWLYVDFFTLTIEHVGYSLISVHGYYSFLTCSIANDTINSYKINTYKRIFEDLWTNASSEVKKEIIDIDITNKSSICASLCRLKDLKLIELFLKDVNMAKRRQLLLLCLYLNYPLIDLDFYKDVAEKLILIEEEMVLLKSECANKAYEICKDYYYHGPYYNNRFVNKSMMLDSFLQFCLPLTENVTDFKKGLINQGIVFDLMKGHPSERQLELIDECLKWCELTENEIEEVKINLVYGSTVVIRSIDIFSFCNERIIGLNMVLNWCLHTPERIIEFKTKRLVHSYYFIEKLFECVRNKYNVDKCLNWCFSSKDEIDEYKRNLLYKFKLSPRFKHIHKYDEYLNNVKKCVEFCMFSTETLENWWSENFPFSPIEFRDYELFDAIMSLYYPNFLEMKKNLLLSDFGVSICIDYIVCIYENILKGERSKESIFSQELIDKFQWCRDPAALSVIDYLYWLNPNAETISQFKDLFEKDNQSNLVQNFNSLLFDLLDTLPNLKTKLSINCIRY